MTSYWIEGDRDLGERSYNGKPDVLQHVEDVKSQLVLVTVKSVTVQGQRGTTKDEMTVRGHQQHECETDVIFRGDLIAQVHHCLRHPHHQ